MRLISSLVIQHISVVHREDLLTYVIVISTAVTENRYSVSYDNLPGHVFSVTALFDTCYQIEVNASNCVGVTRYFSTNLYFPKIEE